MKILLVDNSPLVSRKLEEFLKELPQISLVRSVRNENEALEVLFSINPDVVILDISMPDKGGMTLLRYIKETMPQIRVIIVSNWIDEFYKRICLKLGAIAYLDKTYELEELKKVISALS